ncbi:MAG TPA: hypothetical protein VFE47_21650 [Tepidisphaeraceae bacterium]|jgi:hypothetical protein|nr:hypothetical protein [Tepidisphaeraceae bacterium]
MIRPDDQLSEPSAADAALQPFTGEVVFLYAFDVAYEMARKPADRLLGQPLAEFSAGAYLYSAIAKSE